MKNNYLTLLLIGIVAYFCIFATTSNEDENEKPSVSIVSRNQFPCMLGEVVTYEIKICSQSALEEITIEPSIIGDKNTGNFAFKFTLNEKCKTIIYKYCVPHSLSKDLVTLTIKVSNITSSCEHNENISVYNPPSFDKDFIAMLSLKF